MTTATAPQPVPADATLRHPRGPLSYLAPLGRLLFVAIFLASGPGHFTQQMIDYAANAGVPAPAVAVPASGIIAVVGALSVLLGFYARIGAWLLIIFLVPVTLMMHQFWTYDDQQMRQMQQAAFMKNVSMTGAALFIACVGAGPWSMDERRRANRRV